MLREFLMRLLAETWQGALEGMGSWTEPDQALPGGTRDCRHDRLPPSSGAGIPHGIRGLVLLRK